MRLAEQHDLPILLADPQPKSQRHGGAHALRDGYPEDPADADLRRRALDHQLQRAIAVHLGDRLRKREIVDVDQPLLPGRELLDRRTIAYDGTAPVYDQTLTRRQCE